MYFSCRRPLEAPVALVRLEETVQTPPRQEIPPLTNRSELAPHGSTVHHSLGQRSLLWDCLFIKYLDFNQVKVLTQVALEVQE